MKTKPIRQKSEVPILIACALYGIVVAFGTPFLIWLWGIPAR